MSDPTSSHPELGVDTAVHVHALGRPVADSAEFQATLERALALVVPVVADYAFVHLVDPDLEIVLAASRHGNPEKSLQLDALLTRLHDQMTASGSVISNCVRSGEAHQVTGTAEGAVELAGGDPELEALVRSLGPRSFMVVPLATASGIVGSLSFARFEDQRPYDEQDLDFGRAVAGQTGLAIDQVVQFDEADRARAEAVETADEVRFQARVLDAVGEAVAAVDLRGEIIYWNHAAELLYGFSKEEAMGSDLSVTAPADASRAELTEAMETLTGGESWTGDVTLRRRDGSTFPAQLTGTPFHGDDGAPLGIITIVRDKTEQKALEGQVIQAQRLQAVGGLAGGVAHDLNNALTGIQGFTDLLLQDLPPTSSARGDLQEIQEAANRAGTLVQQLLAFSRRQLLQPTELDLNRVVMGMSSVLERTLREDVEMVQELDPDIGTVHADARQLEQVILNLVQNASEAMPTGGRLVLKTENATIGDDEANGFGYDVEAGPYVVLTVQDTGVGMPPEVAERAFEPFFTTKMPGTGPGLGLSTVYGIVKQSNGYVWIDSTIDEGTAVKVFLPQVEEEAPVEAEPEEQPSDASTRILLVEDDEAVRTVIRRILTREGYEVLEAANGREALHVAGVGAFDAVITDVVMPEMNGRQMVDELAKEQPDLPVLFISGHTDDRVARHGIAEGGYQFLAKPFTTDALIERVKQLLET